MACFGPCGSPEPKFGSLHGFTAGLNSDIESAVAAMNVFLSESDDDYKMLCHAVIF